MEPNKTDAVSESAMNPPMELPTASNVHTFYCKTSLLKHQDCVRHGDLLCEEFVRILRQTQSSTLYWNLHQAHIRVVTKEEVEDCNDEKLREAIYTIPVAASSEHTIISVGLEILHHQSLESTFILNKVFLASILFKGHKKLYMVTFVSGQSLQAGESHTYVDVFLERNTTSIACSKNVIMVNWNINESSDSFSMNLIKKNHAAVITVIYDVYFPRRLLSPLGSFLVYVFYGGEAMILWSILAPTALMRIFGSSSNITIIFTKEILQSPEDIGITKISSFIQMHLLSLRFRKGNVESVVYWKVLHSGVYKLRIWDVHNPQM